MRVSRVLMTVCVLAFSPAAALAQQSFSGQPDRTDWRKTDIAPSGKWMISLEYDSILARDLEDADVTGVEKDNTGAVVDNLDPGTEARGVEMESSFVYLRAAYALYSSPGAFGLEGYLMLGAADLSLEGDVSSPGDPVDDFDVDGDFAFAFGAGLRARVWSSEKFSILADASFRWSRHDSSIEKVNELNLDLGAGESGDQDFETTLLGWQLSAIASYELSAGGTLIIPYAGLRLSGVNVETEGKQDFFDPGFDKSQEIDYDTSEDDIFGIVVGVEAIFSENLGAFLEIRAIDELAVTLGVGWKF